MRLVFWQLSHNNSRVLMFNVLKGGHNYKQDTHKYQRTRVTPVVVAAQR